MYIALFIHNNTAFAFNFNFNAKFRKVLILWYTKYSLLHAENGKFCVLLSFSVSLFFQWTENWCDLLLTAEAVVSHLCLRKTENHQAFLITHWKLWWKRKHRNRLQFASWQSGKNSTEIILHSLWFNFLFASAIDNHFYGFVVAWNFIGHFCILIVIIEFHIFQLNELRTTVSILIKMHFNLA